MKILKSIIFFLLIFSTIISCSRYELDDPAPVNISTFSTIIGGTGYDIAHDAIELDDSYLIVGKVGPKCDIVDGYIVKIDKETGAVKESNRFGNVNLGFEETFFSVVRASSDLIYTAGFSNEQDDTCSYGYGADVNLFSINKDLVKISNDTITGDENSEYTWDAINHLFIDDDKLYGTGQYNGLLAFYSINTATGTVEVDTTRLTGGAKYGGIMNGIIDKHERAVLVGQSGGSGTDLNLPLNTYFGMKDFNAPNLIVDTFYVCPFREISEGRAIVQLKDNTYRIAVKAYDFDPNQTSLVGNVKEGLIVLLKLDANGMNPEFIPIPIGTNDIVNDMVKVEDGLVIVGALNVDPAKKSDIGLIKIDFEGNLIWHRSFDLNDEIAFSLIQTEDEGFLIVGRTKVANFDNLNTILIYKTDKEGLIEK
jgi:hypothetical protein